VVGRQNTAIADTLQWMLPWQPLSMGYNFGCVIASDTLFRGWVFTVKLSDEDMADFEFLRDVAMATVFGFLYIWGAYWRHLANTIERL